MIKAICEPMVRLGYRHVHLLLRRAGWRINQKKTSRIYSELGMQLRKKTRKKRVKAKLHGDRRDAVTPNETVAMHFVHDQLSTGRKIRVLTVADTFSRVSSGIDARFSHRAVNGVETPGQVCARVGYPKTIRVDQGSAFVSHDLDLWAYDNVTLTVWRKDNITEWPHSRLGWQTPERLPEPSPSIGA
jgi:putative transposase